MNLTRFGGLLAALLLLSCCACGSSEPPPQTAAAAPPPPPPIVEPVEQNAGHFEQLAANFVSAANEHYFIDSALCSAANETGQATCSVFFCVAESPGDIVDKCPADAALNTTDTVCIDTGCGKPPPDGGQVVYAQAAQSVQYVQMPPEQRRDYESSTDKFLDFYMDYMMVSLMFDAVGGGFGGGGNRWDRWDSGGYRDYDPPERTRDRYSSRTTTNTTIVNNYYRDSSGKAAKGDSAAAKAAVKSKKTTPPKKTAATPPPKKPPTGYKAGAAHAQAEADKKKAAQAKSTKPATGYKSGAPPSSAKKTQGKVKPKQTKKTSKPKKSRSSSRSRGRSGGRSRSSATLKTDIRPYDRGLDLVERLEPRTWTWRDDAPDDVDPEATTGFIAEELAAVAPEFVWHDETGAVGGVHYELLAAAFVNALQEQQAQIDALRRTCGGPR